MHFLILSLTSLISFISPSEQNHFVEAIPIYGNYADGYYITLKIGNPPQEINVLVDTGSSNLAIAATDNATYNLSNFFHIDVSRSFQKLNETLHVEYTEGSWDGILGTDLVSFRDVLSIRANLACITSSQNFFSNSSKWQGILGLAYNQIAKPNLSFISFFDTLMKNLNTTDVFSMSLCGKDQNHGELVLGGVSSSLYSGELFYTPIVREWYYEVSVTDFAVGDHHWPHSCRELNNDKTIVDSGTSDFRLPKHVFSWFVETLWMHANITMPKTWMTNQIICLHNDILSRLPVLSLTLFGKGRPFNLNISPKSYLRRAVENSQNCHKITISPSDKGTVIGAAILEGFYVVFDREKKAVGFGNITGVQNGSLPSNWVSFATRNRGADIADCVSPREYNESDSVLNITAYILVAVCVVCFVPLLVMLLHWIWHHLVCFKGDAESTGLLEEYR